jgi:hypothetical protein
MLYLPQSQASMKEKDTLYSYFFRITPQSQASMKEEEKELVVSIGSLKSAVVVLGSQEAKRAQQAAELKARRMNKPEQSAEYKAMFIISMQCL